MQQCMEVSRLVGWQACQYCVTEQNIGNNSCAHVFQVVYWRSVSVMGMVQLKSTIVTGLFLTPLHVLKRSMLKYN